MSPNDREEDLVSLAAGFLNHDLDFGGVGFFDTSRELIAELE